MSKTGPSSLLDQVLSNKANPTAGSLLSPKDDQPHQLPDGSEIYDSTIAAINRILSLNPHLNKRPTGVSGHSYELYNGDVPVDLNDKRTFLSLIRADWTPKTPHQLVLLMEYVEKYAPTFSLDCVVISDHLIWDRKTGTLHTFTDEDDIRTVS